MEIFRVKRWLKQQDLGRVVIFQGGKILVALDSDGDTIASLSEPIYREGPLKFFPINLLELITRELMRLGRRWIVVEGCIEQPGGRGRSFSSCHGCPIPESELSCKTFCNHN